MPKTVLPSRSLHKLIMSVMDETEVRAAAQKIGVDYGALEPNTFMGKAHRLVNYVIYHGRTTEFLSYCHEFHPELPWLDIGKGIEKESEEKFVDALGNPLEQLRLVLYHFFGSYELRDLVIEFNIDPNEQPFPYYFCVWIKQLTDEKRFLDVLQRVKELRPFLPQAQNIPLLFSYNTPNQPSRFAEECERDQKSAANRKNKEPQKTRERQRDLQFLVPILDEQFDETELNEICFDCGIRNVYKILGERRLDFLKRIILELEQSTSLYHQFLHVCQRHKPEVNWAKISGLDLETIKPEQDSIQRFGHYKHYDSFQIRLLCKQAWPTNESVLNFCDTHFRMVRGNLSIEMTCCQNIQAFIGAMWRRGDFPKLLETLNEQYPTAYAQFAPYSWEV